MAENTKITPQQRHMNFVTLTRQNRHMMPKQTVSTPATTVQFTYPKTRLLSKTTIHVKGEVTIKHASKTAVPAENLDAFTPFKIIRRISQDLNNGFTPFVVSGKELAMANMMRTNPGILAPSSDAGAYVNVPATWTASASGTKNKFEFCLELQNTLNNNQLLGLIMLQNSATMVNLVVDIGNGADLFDNASGFTVDIDSVDITPMIETFTIPADERAFPDISVLKLLQSKTVTYPSGGDNTVYLDTGRIYRKLIFYIEDTAGKPIEDSAIKGNMQLSFNTADIPYSISPEMLRKLNCEQFSYSFPKGLYIFDFSSQSPLIGYGGNRDYIDTEKLTQFTLDLQTTAGCKVTTIYETLSRLRS